MQRLWRPRHGHARRHFQVAHHLIPFGAHAAFQGETFQRHPVILHVLRRLQVLAVLERISLEGHQPGHRTIVAQHLVIVTLHLLMEALAFHVRAEFQVMLAVEMRGGQKQVGRRLLPVPMPVHAAEVIAAITVGRDLVDQVPTRRIVELPACVGEPDIEQRPAEVVLVANRTHVRRLADIGAWSPPDSGCSTHCG